MTFRAAVLATGFAVLFGQVAMAREPGAPTGFPPGLNLGKPIAAPLPDGYYGESTTAYYRAKLRDKNGNTLDQETTLATEALKFIWSPGWEMLGANYRGFVALPMNYVHNELGSNQVGPKGEYDGTGLANVKLHPLDLSWKVYDGLFVNTSLGVYFPIGGWKRSPKPNTAANFFTFETSLGITYLKDGWNATVQTIYNKSLKNPETNYQSGDMLFANFSLMKDVGDGWNLGPVGYFDAQVTDDSNNGNAYGGREFDRPVQVAFGGAVSRLFGPVGVNLQYTHDFVARNTLGGNKAALYLTWKFN